MLEVTINGIYCSNRRLHIVYNFTLTQICFLLTATAEPRQLVPWPEALLSSCWAQHSPAAVVFLPTLAACTNTAKQRGNLCKGLLLHSSSTPRQFLPWGLFHTLAELAGTSGIPLLQPHCSSQAVAGACPGSGISNAAAYPNNQVSKLFM